MAKSLLVVTDRNPLGLVEAKNRNCYKDVRYTVISWNPNTKCIAMGDWNKNLEDCPELHLVQLSEVVQSSSPFSQYICLLSLHPG